MKRDESIPISERKKRHVRSVRKSQMKSRYGITIEEYDEAFELQDGACAICMKPQKRRLSVDHDHATGNFRGLLCVSCNFGLGSFKEDQEILMAAIGYLDDHKR